MVSHVEPKRLPIDRVVIASAVLFFVIGRVQGGEYRATVGSGTIARTSAMEILSEEGVAETPDGLAPELFDDPSGCNDSCFDPYCADNWMTAEYLLWWRKGRELPALVTTSPIGTALTDAGVLGLPATTTIYGQDDVGTGGRPGGRFSIGAWCDPCRVWSIATQVAFLGDSNTHAEFSNAEQAILARPFFNVTDGQIVQQDSLVTAFPGLRTGTIFVETSSDLLTGDVYLRRLVSDRGSSRLDFQFGYQFSRIDEALQIRSVTDAQDLAATLTVTDRFWTRNEFHGGSLGLAYASDQGRWSCRSLVKIGLGNMHQTARLSGEQIIDDGVAPAITATGLLVQTTNRGTMSRNSFAVVPELNLSASLHVTSNFDISCGYSYILWTDVLQPGGAIDPALAVNLANPPTAQRPQNGMSDGSYWAHGLSLGLAWRY